MQENNHIEVVGVLYVLLFLFGFHLLGELSMHEMILKTRCTKVSIWLFYARLVFQFFFVRQLFLEELNLFMLQ